MNYKQGQPFNNDTILHGHIRSLRDKHKITTFFETGTYLGCSTKYTADDFEKVITVEINPQNHKFAKNHCAGKSNITFILGDSPKAIRTTEVGNDTLFFLDAHWEQVCPLLDELKEIAAKKLKPVIVIHDFFVPEKSKLSEPYKEFGFDSYNGQPFTFEWIKDGVEAIYGKDYKVSYPDKVEGALRGYITIEPA